MKQLLYPLLFLVACAGSQKEVTMQGSDLDIARVAGEWQGEYKGEDSGRSGPVSFSLEVGSHIAEGTVMMGPKPLKIVRNDLAQGDARPRRFEQFTKYIARNVVLAAPRIAHGHDGATDMIGRRGTVLLDRLAHRLAPSSL